MRFWDLDYIVKRERGQASVLPSLRTCKAKRLLQINQVPTRLWGRHNFPNICCLPVSCCAEGLETLGSTLLGYRGHQSAPGLWVDQEGVGHVGRPRGCIPDHCIQPLVLVLHTV